MKNNLKLIDGETGKELKGRSKIVRAKYIIIQEGVTSIGEWAFAHCTSLTCITIPDSVTSIGASAFHNCTSLTSIIIPNSVTSIGKDAFLFCNSLGDVHYNGTKHEFRQISKYFVNISSLKTIHCIDGDYSLIDQKNKF